MASFISYENQTLLWNTMQNVPIFKEVIHVAIKQYGSKSNRRNL